MTRAAYYPEADRKAQNFHGKYRGSNIAPNVVVIHTTEGTSWPGYGGGGSAPHLTAMPSRSGKKLNWRQHFPLTHSARALNNDAGGVETNTLNCVQVELIGTCDPKHRGNSKWFYWPDAPDWALYEVAEFVAFMHREWALRLTSVPPSKWLPYPKSYGSKNGQRLSGNAWRNFYGVCGHQHVPENSHGDPGDLDIAKVMNRAKSLVKPAPARPTFPRAVRVEDIAADALKVKQSVANKKHWETILSSSRAIQKKKG